MSNDSGADDQSTIRETFNRINEQSNKFDSALNQRVRDFIESREMDRRERDDFIEKWIQNRNSISDSKQTFVERYTNSYIKRRNSSLETKKVIFDRDIMNESRLKRNKAKIEVAKMSFKEFEENLIPDIE